MLENYSCCAIYSVAATEVQVTPHPVELSGCDGTEHGPVSLLLEVRQRHEGAVMLARI